MTSHPAARHRRLREGGVVGLVVLVGLLVTVLLSAVLANQESHRRWTQLEARTREAAGRIQSEVRAAFDAAIAVRALVSRDPELTAEEFRYFAHEGGLLMAFPRIQAISWARWEPSLGADGAVVVTHVEPRLGNEGALGFDLRGEERRRRAVDRARDQGIPAVSEPIQLVQDPDGSPSILLLVPVYASGQSHSTGPERRRSFLGVASMVLRTDALLSSVLPAGSPIALAVTDAGPVEASNDGPGVTLFAGDGAPAPGDPDSLALDTSVGDRRWRLHAVLLTSSTVTPAWLVAAVAGAILTFLLAALVATQRAARQRAETLVDRRTAELREANAQLRAANEAKSTFLGTVSHELRTPLTAITGFIAMLRKDGVAKDERLSADLLTRLDRNARSLTTLIEEILTFSQLEALPEAPDLEMVDLQALIDEALDSLGPLLASATLKRDLTPIRAMANADGIHRMLVNLVTNAVKYGAPDVVIEVSLRTVGENIELTVADNGPGISPDEADRVFDRFFRGKATTGTPGTGIGLSIVRELALQQGGHVRLDPGQAFGATFVVTLPLRQQAPTQDPLGRPGSGGSR